MSDGRSIKKYFEDGWQTLPEQTRRYPSFIPCLPACLPACTYERLYLHQILLCCVMFTVMLLVV
jgi:hypothetical protein